MNQTTQILSLLGLLYDAALDINKWEPFLHSCCDAFTSDRGQIFYVENADIPHLQNLTFSCTYNIDMEFFAKWTELAKKDPRMPIRKSYGDKEGFPKSFNESDVERYLSGETIHDRLFTTDDYLHASELYKQVLYPSNIEYTCSFNYPFHDSLNTSAALGLMRSRSGLEYTFKDCELFDHVRPHVIRAIKIHRELARLDMERQMALGTLNNIHMGIVLIDRYHHILFKNDHAQEVLNGQDGIKQQASRIKCRNKSAQQSLDEAIDRVIEQAASNRPVQGQALTMTRPSCKRPYSLLISPLWANLIRIESDHLDYPLATVFIHDPEVAPNSQAGILRQLYQLTRTEAEILDRLVHGDSVKVQADKMQVQDNTVRQHLKHIFEKTETASQVELIQHVLSNPLWFAMQTYSYN